MSVTPDPIADYAKRGGRLPSIGPIRDSFWAGYYGIGGPRKGIPSSVQRRAYEAGQERAKVEPDLKP